MFDFLNKLTHEHQKPQEAPLSVEIQPELSPSPPAQSAQLPLKEKSDMQLDLQSQDVVNSREEYRKPRKQEKKAKKIVSQTAKLQQGVRADLDPEAVAAFKTMLKESSQEVSGILRDGLSKMKQSTEKKVYIREMSLNEDEYFKQSNKATNLQSAIDQQLRSITGGVVDSIVRDIQSEKMETRLKRKRFLDDGQEKKIEAMKLIQQQQSQLHDKIGELQVELRQSNFLERRVHQITDKSEFKVDNVKTRMAEQFVKGMQREQEEQRIKMSEMKEKKRALSVQLQAQQQTEAERLKQERHLRLMEQFVEKQRAKKEKQERERVEKLNFKSFLKEYNLQKPLYKKKEEDFQKAQNQEKMDRYNTLKKNQARYEPLNVQTIQTHEEKYLELKNEDRQRKKAEMVLAKHEQKLRKRQLQQKVYKGKFRYIVLNELVEEDAKKKEKEEEKKLILAKKQAYSLEVKERYRPAIDPNKRHEIQEIINSHQGRKKRYETPTNRVAYSERYSTISRPYSDVQSEPDPKKDGKRYHRLFKQYIRDKIDKGEVKEQVERVQQTYTPRPDYLKELREKYSDRIPSRVVRLDKQIEKIKDAEDFRILAIKAEQFEGKVKQREKKIRNIPHKPEDEARLQQDYICAIKAKMELISNID